MHLLSLFIATFDCSRLRVEYDKEMMEWICWEQSRRPSYRLNLPPKPQERWQIKVLVEIPKRSEKPGGDKRLHPAFFFAGGKRVDRSHRRYVQKVLWTIVQLIVFPLCQCWSAMSNPALHCGFLAPQTPGEWQVICGRNTNSIWPKKKGKLWWIFRRWPTTVSPPIFSTFSDLVTPSKVVYFLCS